MALHTQIENLSNQFIWDEALRRIFINFDDTMIYDPVTGILSVRPCEIINNLTSSLTNASLSANMGRVLNETKLNTFDFNIHKNDTAVHMSVAEKNRLQNSIQYAEIVDNLTSTALNKPLSANQGRILENRINYLETNPTPIVDNLNSTASNHALSANMGRTLNINKVEKSIFDSHNLDNVKHVTSADRSKWNSALYGTDVVNSLTSVSVDKPLSANMGKELNDKIPDIFTVNSHIGDTGIHVTNAEKSRWNDKISQEQLSVHTDDIPLHVSVDDRRRWDAKIDGLDLTTHINDTAVHVTPQLKEKIDTALQKADVVNVLTSYTTNIPLSANMGRVLAGMIPNKNAVELHMASTDIHITPAERIHWNNALQRIDVVNSLTGTNIDLPLSAAMGKKLQDEKTPLSSFNGHNTDETRHITSAERSAWNDCIRSATFNTHVNDGVKHITSAERSSWNDKPSNSSFNSHTGNTTAHITAGERNYWNSALQPGSVVDHLGSTSTNTPLSANQGRILNITKAPLSSPVFSGTVQTSNYIRMSGTRYVHCDAAQSIGFLNSGGNWVFRVDESGNCYPSARMYNAVYNDYAEYYTTYVETEPGDVLMLGDKPNEYVLATEGSTKVVGVVSDSFGFILGGTPDDGNTNKSAVGLKGKVPVKVIGDVDNGDLLVPSNTPGVARAYEEGDNILSIFGMVIDNEKRDGLVLMNIR